MARGKMTAQAVAMAFVTGSVTGIQDLEVRLGEIASENVLKKACDEVSSYGGNAEDLEAFLNERYPQSEGRQGRKAVQVGETRKYKVSDNGTISVSAKAWGLQPGDSVALLYSQTGIELA